MRNLTIAEAQVVGGMGDTSVSTIAGAAFGGTVMLPFAVWRGAATASALGSGIGTGLLGFGLILGAYVVGGALVGAVIANGVSNMLNHPHH